MNKKPKVFTYDIPNCLDNVTSLSIDTEAMGLNINRDRLCVVQMLVNEDEIYVVHFPEANYAAPNLKKLLSNDKIVKLFHFARFDVHIIYKYLVSKDQKLIECLKHKI